MTEERFDLRIPHPGEAEKRKKQTQLLFRLNHTMPMTDEYTELLNELFENHIGEGSFVSAPLQGVCFDKVIIGKNVFINGNCLMMSRGGITIEDDVTIAANASLISNNHDLYERQVLICKPVVKAARKACAGDDPGRTIFASIEPNRNPGLISSQRKNRAEQKLRAIFFVQIFIYT